MALAIILGEEYCVDFQFTLLEEPKGGGTILYVPIQGGNFLMFGLKGNEILFGYNHLCACQPK